MERGHQLVCIWQMPHIECIISGFESHSTLAFIMNFEPSFSYYPFIHDPNMFVNSANPESMPRILIPMSANYGQKMFYIKAILHVKMNLQRSPCEEVTSYSLTSCLRNKISQKIGCRPEWDRWSDYELEICTNMEQLKMLEYDFDHLSCVGSSEAGF